MNNGFNNIPEFYKFLEEYNDRFKGEILSAAEIKAIRKDYNLSQLSFANMLSISVKTLQNYEINKRKPPITASSFFKFVSENKKLFQSKYLKKIENPRPFQQ